MIHRIYNNSIPGSFSQNVDRSQIWPFKAILRNQVTGLKLIELLTIEHVRREHMNTIGQDSQRNRRKG